MVTNISPKAEILLKCYLIIIIIIIISLLSGLMLFPGKKKWHNSGHQPVFLVLQLLFLFCHFISNTFCIILAVPSKQGFTIICAFFFFFLSNASVKWACGIYQQAFPTFLVNNSCRLCSRVFSVCIGKFHKILQFSYSKTFFGLCIYHFSALLNPHFSQSFQ